MRNLVLLTETERSAASVVAWSAHDRVVDVRPDPHVGGVLVLTERGVLARFDDDDDEPRRSTRLDDPDEATRRWFRVDPHPDGRGAVAISDRAVVVWNDSVEGGEITTVYAAAPGTTVRDGRWSPDGEVLCLCLTEENDGALSSVTLNAEFETMREVVVASSVRSSGRASVSWRPDGAAVALCASATDQDDDDEAAATTRLWILDRDASETTAVGREEDGAGRSARWLDDGAGAAWGGDHVDFIVAAVRRRPGSDDKPPTVVFFEPNGLRHRDFDGRDADSVIKDLAWNADSDLLATVGDHDVRLWTRGNWTWYLKRDVRFANDATIVGARFDEEDPHRLLVLLDDARWFTYDLAWDHATVDATGTAASVDGARLKATPLARTIVPPPMCLHVVDLPANANEVAHCDLPRVDHDDDDDVGKHPAMVATLSDGSLAVMSGYAAPKEGAPRRPPRETPTVVSVVRSVEGLDTSSSLSLRHVTVLDHDPVSSTLTLTAVVRRSSSADELLELRLSLRDDAARVEHRVVLEGRVLRSCPVRSRGGSTVVRREEKAVLQLLDGSLCSYLGDGLVLPFDDADGDDALGEPCPWMSVVVDDDASRRRANPLVVGRSRHHRLWRGDVVLDDAVSSHVVDDESLCFATLGAAAAVRALPLASLRDHDPLDVADHHHDHHERPLERGSVLLTSSSRDCRVVVQVQPRGSLEAAHPRALVVPRACRLATTERDVGAAVELARRQRLDLNLLVDVDPRRFLDGGGAKELVDGVLDVSPDPADRLTLLVANLRSGEDVTAGRHRVPPDVPRSSTWADDGLDLSDKVNAVCRALRSALSERDDDDSALLFPILATLAREEPPRLEDALLLARDRRSDDRPAALAYLASLADWTSLYRAALGTHDLDLARAVARESPDADPRDYGPKLRRWRDLRPPTLAKYEIDLELGRFDAALRHLVEGRADAVEGEPWFETCLSLVNEHRLHETALELFPASDKGSSTSDERRRILSSLGERLLREVDGASAATTVFLAAGNVDGARRAARAAGDWRTLWDTHVNDENDENVDLPALAASIAEDLVAGAAPADFRAVRRDAAVLLAEHAGNVDAAIDSLIEGAWWEEALRRAGSSAPRRARVVDGARRRLLEETLPDLEERAETSVRTIERHDVVATLLRKRGDHDLNEEPPPHDSHDQDGQDSVYSAATDATAASLRSVASVNSVISAGDRSTFSITSVDDAHKHKSKYNRVGQQHKKKRKKKKRHRHNKGKSSVARPNTRAELDDLVATLRGARVDDDERDVLEDAARCLARAGRTADARAAIGTYARCRDAVEAARRRRRAADRPGTDPRDDDVVDDAATWPALSAETTRTLSWL